MTLSALHAQYVRRHKAHHNRQPSQTRTTKLYCCRRCDAMFFTPPFISCKDGHTKICSDCSLIEDLETAGMKAPYDGPQYWTIEQHLRATAAEGLATTTHPSAPCAVPAPALIAPQPAADPPRAATSEAPVPAGSDL